MRNTLLWMAFTGATGVFVALGCSSEPPDSGTGLPPRTTNTKDAEASTSSGSPEVDSGSAYDCTNRAPVDDNPQCDQCARSKCCEYIVKCDESPQCKAAMKCIEECPDGDTVCVFGCSATGGAGAVILQDFGACLTTECENDCSSAQPSDAGFDAPF